MAVGAPVGEIWMGTCAWLCCQQQRVNLLESLLSYTWTTFEVRPLLEIWHKLSNVSGPQSQFQEWLFCLCSCLLPWRRALGLKKRGGRVRERLCKYFLKRLNWNWILNCSLDRGGKNRVPGTGVFLHCKCNFVFFFFFSIIFFFCLLPRRRLKNSYQICFFMSHFLQVEPLIIPIPIADSFLDWTPVWSCCLLSLSVSLCGKLYSLHALIETDGVEILITQYIYS